MDNCGNTNMDYNVDDTESVLNFGRVIICDYVEPCLCFGNMFASVFSSKVSQCLQLLTFRRFGEKIKQKQNRKMLGRTKEQRK